MGYAFEPEALHAVVRQLVGVERAAIVPAAVAALDERFPGAILGKREWVFNNAGGAMGQIMLLHASLREYLLLFATAIGTEGCSGRFTADDWFFVLDGEHWCYREGELEREVTRPGEVACLARGQMKHYRIPDSVVALEYARGAIPLMLPFALADTFSSTLDVTTLQRTLALYARATARSLLRR